MGIKRIQIRPKGSGTYEDVLYPETDTSAVKVTGTETALDTKLSTMQGEIDAVETALAGKLDASGVVASATKLAAARTIDGVSFDGSTDITHYGTTSASVSTQTKATTITGFNLTLGARVTVKFGYANSHATPNLNVNNTGAIPMKKADGTAFADIKAGGVYTFVYDGTAFIVQGEGGDNLKYEDVVATYQETIEKGEFVGLGGDVNSVSIVSDISGSITSSFSPTVLTATSDGKYIAIGHNSGSSSESGLVIYGVNGTNITPIVNGTKISSQISGVTINKDNNLIAFIGGGTNNTVNLHSFVNGLYGASGNIRATKYGGAMHIEFSEENDWLLSCHYGNYGVVMTKGVPNSAYPTSTPTFSDLGNTSGINGAYCGTFIPKSEYVVCSGMVHEASLGYDNRKICWVRYNTGLASLSHGSMVLDDIMSYKMIVNKTGEFLVCLGTSAPYLSIYKLEKSSSGITAIKLATPTLPDFAKHSSNMYWISDYTFVLSNSGSPMEASSYTYDSATNTFLKVATTTIPTGVRQLKVFKPSNSNKVYSLNISPKKIDVTTVSEGLANIKAYNYVKGNTYKYIGIAPSTDVANKSHTIKTIKGL